ncbi:hypothetical protein [Paracholeplasma manati]|uniref:YokE-like PH domain-containing protein n=1 Tax=Paracholeplasma manati TaxID=591373 RepID=A0ABT2Y4L2_9MOLU|nr:hypothetical protein [Paracholeplasma manati]MCV2231666.1 hypothetical protein [Paracholeplasma manati]MDG0888591.1 hypothetical protein [Paracholeplasma manati]
MKTLQMIELLKIHEDLASLKPMRIGVLPNDGLIIPGFPEALLTFDLDQFTIYTFEGLIKLTYEHQKYTFSFSEIKEIEMGKYNFKDRYLKITFKDDRYVAFSYHLNDKKYPDQSTLIEAFMHKLESLAN